MNSNKTDKESILLVDDSSANLQMLLQTLNVLGCELLIAKNGESALTIANKAKPDLILLDIMMPGIDGFEVCRRLKAEPATREIPVVFLSALDDTQDKVKGLQLGAVDYVSKPFQPDEVTARVVTHLTIHRLKREVQNQRDQLEHELEVVSQVQKRLLPRDLPPVDGLSLAAHYETSRYAGGDYYDFLEIADYGWGFLMADAEGHSAPAAVLMAMTCSLFRSYPGPATAPDDVIRYLNHHLRKVAGPSFVTALYAVYHTHRRTLHIARAGQPPPIIYRSSENRAAELVSDGVFPLGIYPYDQVPVTETTLMPGDRLLLYTDGVFERFNGEGREYGKARLIERFGDTRTDDPRDVIDAMVADVEQFAAGRPADDDQALLVGIVR